MGSTQKTVSSRRPVTTMKLSMAALRTSMVAIAAVLALPSVAQAQSSQASPPTGQSSPAPGDAPAETTDSGNQLGDVVVTARRVSERLQDIPASVSAVGQDQVARFSSLNDLQSAVSGVTFKSFGPVTVVGLRGFGNRSNTQGPNNAVGIFQDGVFIAPFLNALESRIDVSRVEVAKGPQSTLYGRSTYAGAINIVTNDPTRTPSGYVDAGVGGSAANGENLWHVRAALSGPLTSTLSARAFFVHEQRDGYTYDLNTGNRGYGYDRNAGRIKLLWEPSDQLTVRLAGTIMSDNSPRGEVQAKNVALPPLGGRTLFGDPRITPVFANGPDIWSTNIIRPIAGRVHGQEGTLDLRYRTSIGEIAVLTDYTHSNTNFTTFEPSTLNVVSTPTVTDEQRFSQEVRLSGKTGRFNYLAGLYYLYTKFNYGNSGATLDLNAPFAQFFPGSAPYNLGGVSKILTPTLTTTKAYAGFAQLGYDFTDKLNLTLGIRESRDDVSGTTESDTLLRSGVVVTTVPRVFRQAEFNATTGTANLSYKFNPDIIGYASFSRGDAPGGFNSGAAAGITYAPQKVNAYELGLKSEFLDRHVRLNLALFNNDYTNLQFFQAVFIGGTNNQVTLNAAKARGRGVDLDSTVVLTDSVRLGIQYTYQTSKITKYNIPAAPAPQVSYAGVALVRSPEHAANGSITYSHDLGAGKFQFVAEESYSSSYNNDYQGVPAGTAYPAGPTRPGITPGVTTTQVLGLFRTPGYAITNLNASYTIGHWEGSAYVRNLFNHQYIVASASTDAFTYPLATPGEPRTFEFSIKYSF